MGMAAEATRVDAGDTRLTGTGDRACTVPQVNQAQPLSPPTAPMRPHTREIHGTVAEDPWFWLRDRDDPETITYLEAENTHTESGLGHLDALRTQLFDEMRNRTLETDQSVPVRKGPWSYEAHSTEGLQYAAHLRRPSGQPDSDPVIVLDENVEAGDHDYFGLGDLTVSNDHQLVAFTTDTDGNEEYRLEVRNIETAEVLDPAPGCDAIDELSYGLAWANDNATLFYVRMDEARRPHQIVRHRIGSDPSDDVVIFEESDERFWIGVGTTRSERFVVIGTESKTTSEYWIIDADSPDEAPRLVAERREGVEYRISHHEDRFFILTNLDAVDFRLMQAPIESPGWDSWTEALAHEAGARIEDIDVFSSHLVVSDRSNAVPRMRVYRFGPDGSLDTSPDAVRDVVMPEEVYEAAPGANPEYDTELLRFGYTSMVTPGSVYDHDLATDERVLLKQQPVLGDFDPDRYETKRLWAKASDGTLVPMSVVWRPDIMDGPAPCLLYGYGAYEIVMPATFSNFRLSLLDRGVVFVMAHVRGGGELGRGWYDDGHLEHKANTFSDFITCAEHLIDSGWTTADQLVARGGSAGGLLMGTIANERPDLFAGIVAEVPFVDNVNTMLDATIPLTVTEYDEWGNPNDADAFHWMHEYSPYENVTAQSYPAMLVTAGLNDPRVQYWEPAKWVAKLRLNHTGDAPIYLRTEMGSGHGGPSGRYDAWHDEAFVVAFILDALGISE
jgi:oligopeptidase B